VASAAMSVEALKRRLARSDNADQRGDHFS
jgi:hypothetical protein